MSKEQTILLNSLLSYIPNLEYVENYRPEFLKNNLTTKNFEIDIYLPKFNMGFEYQGAIHFKHINKYNNKPDKSRYNDVLKQEIILRTKDTAIVEIFFNDLKGDIKENIIKRIDNTTDYLRSKRLYTRAMKCERVKLFIKYGLDSIGNKISKKGIESNKDLSFVNIDVLNDLLKLQFMKKGSLNSKVFYKDSYKSIQSDNVRTIKYKIPIKNTGKSKCYKCKELFEENEIVLEIDYANHKLCNFHSKEFLKSQISELKMLLNEINNLK